MIGTIKSILKRLLPHRLFLIYHYGLSFLGALLSGFPASKMEVIFVTGTKGKSTVTELIHNIFEGTGRTHVLVNTIHFALPNKTIPNKLKMTMPGRGKIHRLLAQGRKQGARYAVIEASSEGTLLYRHTFLSPNLLVFTNLHPEHIEAHGSFENYKNAKLKYAKMVGKNKGTVVAHGDDPYTPEFLAHATTKVPYSLSELQNIQEGEHGISFSYKDVEVSLPLPGTFNALNALAALKVAEAYEIPLEEAAKALSQTKKVRGRTEFVTQGQPFDAVVDYAHTPDSLEALYGAFKTKKKVCILGNTGGGRDTWKRPEMARIAEKHCEEVILTNEDPYDEDPQAIIRDMAEGMKKEPTIILDRREAIRYALSNAEENSVVLISGKGTDPYIMGSNGSKTPWDDATVVREELAKLYPNNL